LAPILEFRGVTKIYRLRHETQPYSTLRDALAGAFRRRTQDEEFYALRDVSFEVEAGDAVGIIGRNGAGKSTLLKILSRITPPSSGTIVARGRVASLLEVGTGFHPELTGRENIYLNGSLLGLRRHEIRTAFDAIVDFSGTERFLDTPLKHFSSGMQLRLAFAVAAFLEPEILVIDEVLAVGDAEFQRKCIGKMEDVSRSGRTILFVSHNLSAVQTLCRKCALLDRGTLRLFSADVSGVINAYLTADKAATPPAWRSDGRSHENAHFTPLTLEIVDESGATATGPLLAGGRYAVRIEGEVLEPHPALTIGYALYSEDGTLLYWSYQTDAVDGAALLRRGRNVLVSAFPRELLNEGTYRLEMIGGLHYIQWILEPRTTVPAIYLEVRGFPSRSPYWLAKRPGLLAPRIEWTHE